MFSLILLGLGTLMTWGIWVFVFVRFDPFIGGWVSHMLFYVSFGLALQGSFMLTSIGIYSLSYQSRMHHRYHVGIIARQSFLLVTFLLILLFLASRNLLTWWNIIPLALLVFVIEVGCSSFYHSHDSLRQIKR